MAFLRFSGSAVLLALPLNGAFSGLSMGALSAQEKPKNGVLVRGGVGDQTRGKPVIKKGEKLVFTPHFFEKGAEPLRRGGSLEDAGFKAAEAIGSGAANITVAVHSNGGSVTVEGTKEGDATVKFQLEGSFKGLITESVDVQVITNLDEFAIHFHFVRAVRKPEDISLVTERTDDISNETKRQEVIQPMLDAANKYWEQAGIKFTATHSVTTPSNDTEQGVINAQFTSDGKFDLEVSTVPFFSTFNKSGKVNIYIIKAIKADVGTLDERGVAFRIPKLAKKSEKIYPGGYLVEKALGAIISDKAGNQDAAHEIGHLMGLKDQTVIASFASEKVIKIQDLDELDKINHRVEKQTDTVRNYNLMRAPASPKDPAPTFLFLTEGQARHARTQLGTLKWAG